MICFAWSGFPQYGARCIRKYVMDNPDKEVQVIATRARVPIRGMEELVGCPVRWIDGHLPLPEKEFGFSISNISTLFVDGWNDSAFNELRDKVAANGGKVFCMVDNNLSECEFRFGCIKLRIPRLIEWVKALRFRLTIRGKYSGFFVPGAAGMRLMQFYGARRNAIWTGFYSADGDLFHDGAPLESRERRIIYVGQFCDRKNVLRMVEAFLKANTSRNWKLEIYGSGPLKEKLAALAADADGQIAINDFLQPEELAEKYRKSRALCLASKEEHWGLVVHEAALSGCILCVSNQVGAAEDFATSENGVMFNPLDIIDIEDSFKKIMGMEGDALAVAHAKSLALARKFSPETFSKAVSQMVENNGIA